MQAINFNDPPMETQNCLLCGSNDYAPFATAQDDLTGKPGRWSFVCCKNCTLVYQNPRVARSAIGYYYDDEYIAHRKEKDFGFFDKAVEDITQDSSVTAFAILYRNDNSEDVEGGVGSGSSDYNWILADSVTVVGDAGLTQYIQVTDQTLDQVVINNNYDYITFAINTGSVWIAEDFLISDMTVA